MMEPKPWSRFAIGQLLNNAVCPVCETNSMTGGVCAMCGADLSGEIAAELWASSQAAASALAARQEVLDRVPKVTAPVAQFSTPPNNQSAPQQALSGAQAAPQAAVKSSATVQSVIAIAGAGLFAIAAIVFTFLNPDLKDHLVRSLIVAVITLLFVGGALLLSRKKLQVSAEVVGALSMVFVALDVYAISDLTPPGISPWLFAAIGALISGTIMLALAVRIKIRTWLWLSLIGLIAVPAMLGYASESTLGAAIGHLGVAFAGLAALERFGYFEKRFASKLRLEQVTITVLQIVGVLIATIQIWFVPAHNTSEYWLLGSGMLLAIAVLGAFASRKLLHGFWSLVAGTYGVSAFAVLPFALDLVHDEDATWYFALVPAATAVGALLVSIVLARVKAILKFGSRLGVVLIVSLVALPLVVSSASIGFSSIVASLLKSVDGVSYLFPEHMVLAIAIGLAGLALGVAAINMHSRIQPALKRTDAETVNEEPQATVPTAYSRTTEVLWTSFATISGLTAACIPTIPLWARIGIALVLAVIVSVAVAYLNRKNRVGNSVRIPLVVGVHLAIILATLISLASDSYQIWSGAPIVLALAVASFTVPSNVRFLHVAAGFAWALTTIAVTLNSFGLEPIAVQALTTSLASLSAITATFIRKVRPANWYSILVVTTVPFLYGVYSVIAERSGWTALSTGLIFLLALTLVLTRRPGLGVLVRTFAASILVPTLAVVVICLGAQLLLESASPVTLPIIAAIVALVLPSTGAISTGLEKLGINQQSAKAARIAIEVSTLVTGVIAVSLALIRTAAGLQTTFLVLVIIAVGAAATSIWGGRAYGWWLGAAAITGAIWCQLADAGVTLFEPYLLPPTLGAALVAFILVATGKRPVALFATGLLLAIVPTLVVLAIWGSPIGSLAPWRGYGLIAASWLLLLIGIALGLGSGKVSDRLRELRSPTLGAAIIAGSAGAIEGVRIGLKLDAVDLGGLSLVFICLLVSFAGAIPAAITGALIRKVSAQGSRLANSRWMLAPAIAYVPIAAWSAIHRDWVTIWTVWALMIALLVLVVATAARQRGKEPIALPPVVFTFAIAFVTAIVAWSPRDLRVEWFSLPLGLFLLLAGILHLRRTASEPEAAERRIGTFSSWPANWQGSWPLLAPGITVTFLASILATFTDPQTWRAILVIVLALVSILAGSSLRLASPFILGVIVLPLENVFVFLVQIGRGVASMPWWITLAIVGAVLLIIAVSYERKSGEAEGFTARMRDLR